MRAFLLTAALLLTAGLAITPPSTAVDCAGNVDVACEDQTCTERTTDGCFNYAPAFCLVWSRIPQDNSGDPISTYACIPTSAGEPRSCSNTVDAACWRAACTELSGKD